MPIIYLDNFRGFKNTFLPLRNINFFVGENSTGKTSILRLIRLMSSPKFWFELKFDVVDSELGFYSEVVSKSAKDPSYFEVGIVGDLIDKNDRVSAIRLKFIDSKGLPKVSEIRMIEHGFDIHVKIQKNMLSIGYRELPMENIIDSNKLKYFKFWLDQSQNLDYKYDKIELPDSETSFPIIFIIKSFISDNLVSDKVRDNYKFQGLRLPFFLNDLAWLAPIRAEPHRTYDKHMLSFSPDGKHAPYILKELLSESSKKKKLTEKILNNFGEDSGLFKKIKTTSLKNDDTAPFEIHVYLDDKPIKISNVGYGVSQVLPLILEIIKRDKETWFAIQQPEIHLHPKSQAAFGDFILKSYLTEKKNFIIETHSDFTIDRFRLKVKQEFAKKRKERNIFQVVFFERVKGENKLCTININNNGSYSSSQPASFKEFFIKEQLELLDL